MHKQYSHLSGSASASASQNETVRIVRWPFLCVCVCLYVSWYVPFCLLCSMREYAYMAHGAVIVCFAECIEIKFVQYRPAPTTPSATTTREIRVRISSEHEHTSASMNPIPRISRLQASHSSSCSYRCRCCHRRVHNWLQHFFPLSRRSQSTVARPTLQHNPKLKQKAI